MATGAGIFRRTLGGLAARLTTIGTWLMRTEAYRALVVPVAKGVPYGRVAWRLSGRALVRVSKGCWPRGGRQANVVACVVSFRNDGSATSDQNVLFASLPQLSTGTWLAERSRGFLSDAFHAVTRFRVPGLGKVRWRLLWAAPTGQERRQQGPLTTSVAPFKLQLRELGERAPWVNIAELRLHERVAPDHQTLVWGPGARGRVHAGGLLKFMQHAIEPGSPVRTEPL